MQAIRSARTLSLLAGGASLVALAYAHPATAQQSAQSDQPAASSSSGLEEIVVTARRKEEKAQSVPIAISNVSAQTISEQRITQPTDFMKETTGLSTCCYASRNIFGAQVGGTFGNGYQWIRGVPGVIPYWADVPVQANGGMFFDVASVQLLKGPQGTLFGQATNGGAIVFQPKLPTSVFEGFVEAEVGDYGHTRLQGIVNIPVVDDKVLVRVGGQINRSDGYVYDIAHKTWLGNENQWTGRLAVTIRPTDDIQNDFIGNSFSYQDNPVPGQYRYVNSAVLSAANRAATCTTAACLVTYGGPLGWYAVPGNSNYPTATYESGHGYVAVNTTRWDVSDDFTLKNIAGYVESGAGFVYGGGTVPLTLPPTAYGFNYPQPTGPGIQASDEFQVLGKVLDGKLSFTAGTFLLFNEGNSAPRPKQNITCNGFTATGAPNGCSVTFTYAVDRSNAVYAQGTYDLGDFLEGLSFTGGVRYTWDRAYGNTYQFGPTGATLAGYSANEDSKAASYSMSVDWQIDPKTLLYVTNSKGFSKGGVNLTPSIGPGSGRSFAPESLNNIEAGIKADWDLPLDMQARTNVSFFYGLYDNIQASKLQPNTDALGNVGSTVVTANAANGHVDGIDFDLTLLPTDDIQLSGGGTWVEDKYDEYNYCTTFNAAGTCTNTIDYKSSVFVVTPKWTWHVRLAYTLPIDESLGKATFAANLSHIGPFWGGVGANCTAVNVPAGCPLPPLQNRGPAINTVDLSVSWTSFLGRPGLDARTYVTNLFNGHYGQGSVPTYAGAGSTSEIVAQPRQWGVALKYAFGP